MAQEIVVYAVVILAALNLARIWGASLKSKGGGCGKCSGGGCGSGVGAQAPKASAPQLVQLQVKLKGKE